MSGVKITIWALCLAIFLILSGLVLLAGLSFQGLPIIMGILALIAGIALAVGK